jgi:hypothetical protein
VSPLRLHERIAEFVVPERRQVERLWPALMTTVGDPL